MIVMVGGKNYEIGGLLYGTRPVWELLKHDGKPMTREQFDKLADADKHALHEHAQQYIKNLQGG
jgi:hypothetical protein